MSSQYDAFINLPSQTSVEQVVMTFLEETVPLREVDYFLTEIKNVIRNHMFVEHSTLGIKKNTIDYCAVNSNPDFRLLVVEGGSMNKEYGFLKVTNLDTLSLWVAFKVDPIKRLAHISHSDIEFISVAVSNALTESHFYNLIGRRTNGGQPSPIAVQTLEEDILYSATYDTGVDIKFEGTSYWGKTYFKHVRMLLNGLPMGYYIS